jgi:hypothetical protein
MGGRPGSQWDVPRSRDRTPLHGWNIIGEIQPRERIRLSFAANAVEITD